MTPTDICTNASDDLYVSDGKTLYRETRKNLEKCYNAPDGWSVEALTNSSGSESRGITKIHLLLFLRREDKLKLL